jgi:hypothetical protein
MTHLSVRVYAAISGLIFTLVAIAHLDRLIENWSLMLGSLHVPMWVSVVGFLIPAYLAFEAFHIVWPTGFRSHAKFPGG